MTNQKPEFGNELHVQVKGYGCDDDCKEYFPKASAKKIIADGRKPQRIVMFGKIWTIPALGMVCQM